MGSMQNNVAAQIGIFIQTGFMECVSMPLPESVTTERDDPLPYFIEYTHHSANPSQEGFKTEGDIPPPCSTENTHQAANPSQEGFKTEGDIPAPCSTENTQQAANPSQVSGMALTEALCYLAVIGSVMESQRNGFIRKVYCILMSQLLITVFIIFGFLQIPPYIIFNFFENNFSLICTSLIPISTFLCIFCCEVPRRRAPWNYIFLLQLTLCLATTVGIWTILHDTILEAIVATWITFTIVLGLTLFTFQPKFELNLLTGSCLSIVMALLILGFLILLKTPYDHMRLVYMTIAAIIISIYIVYGTQMIVDESDGHNLSPEDYVFAALLINISIMYIFARILRFFHRLFFRF